MVALVRLLAEIAPVLRQTTDRWIAYEIADFVSAGWTLSDVLHAIDHRPDGTAWAMTTTSVRHVNHWLRFRLQHWTDQVGRPLPSRSQMAQRQHAQDLAAYRC